MVNLTEPDWVRRCPACFRVFSNIDSEVNIRQRYCSNVCLAAGRSRTTLVAKERNKRKEHRDFASRLAGILFQSPRLLGSNLTASDLCNELLADSNKQVFTPKMITGLFRQSKFNQIFEEETEFEFERKETDKAKEFHYIFKCKDLKEKK